MDSLQAAGFSHDRFHLQTQNHEDQGWQIATQIYSPEDKDKHK